MDSDDSSFFLLPLTGKPSSAADFPTNSPVHSATTTTADDDDDEQHFFAAFTHRLTNSTLRRPHNFVSLHQSHAKTTVAGSPQSTLTGFGDWSGLNSVSSDGSPNGPSQAPSPPTTPFGGDNNTSDLISVAIKQVARLKMNTQSSDIINSGFYSYPSQFGTELPICKPESCINWGRQVKDENQQIHGRGGDFHPENGRFVVRTEDFPQYTWRIPSQVCAPAVPAAFHGGGAGIKKECAGTGVFLPRRYDKNSLQSHKRKGKNVSRSVPQITWNGRLPPSHEALMDQRNANISHQQRLSYSGPAGRGKSHEFLLPQEWTY